jgi:hypothetical protein
MLLISDVVLLIFKAFPGTSNAFYSQNARR